MTTSEIQAEELARCIDHTLLNYMVRMINLCKCVHTATPAK
jgi:hypothetical protein